MSWRTRALGALMLGLAVAQPVFAQDKAFGISVRGGGFNGLTNLNESGTADFKQVGYNVGGGVGVDLHKYVGLRGDITFARNELQLNDVETGSELNRFFYDAAVQVQYPTASGFQPYAFVGGGAVTLHPVGSTDSDKTKPAGTADQGVHDVMAGDKLGIGVAGQGWWYGNS